MTQHMLQSRTDDEVLWFQRRSFLQNAAAWTAMGGFAGAQAQSRSNIVELVGDALVNGIRLVPQRTIQTGDRLETGPASSLIFVLGNASCVTRVAACKARAKALKIASITWCASRPLSKRTCKVTPAWLQKPRRNSRR